MNRVAAPISPESAPEAPMSGANSIGALAHWASALTIAVDGHEHQKSRCAKTARHGRPESDEPDRVEEDMRPRAVEEGVGQQGPEFRTAAQGMQVAHRAHLLERGRIRLRPEQKLDRLRRPERDCQSPRNEGEIVDDKVLNAGTRPVERRIDRDERQRERDDNGRRVEHRFVARRRAARHPVHDCQSLSIGRPPWRKSRQTASEPVERR